MNCPGCKAEVTGTLACDNCGYAMCELCMVTNRLGSTVCRNCGASPMKFEANRTHVVLTWDWNIDQDGEYHDPGEMWNALMDAFRPEIAKELMLLSEIADEEWNEFKGGMSLTYNHVERITFEYHPCKGGSITLFKNICSKCDRSCGLAETYCDGTGKSTGKCTDCGTTDSHHGPECVWSKR